MCKRIPLSRGKWALVDDEDFERVNQFKWSCDGNGYACRMVSAWDDKGKRTRKKIMLHRFITDAPAGMEVDHINHNKLDNRRRCNLRVVTRYENHCNSRPLGGTSKYKGVYRHSRDLIWCAEIRVMGTRRHLGTFAEERDAAISYDYAAYAAWQDMAFLNFPEHRHLYLQAITAQRVNSSVNWQPNLAIP